MKLRSFTSKCLESLFLISFIFLVSLSFSLIFSQKTSALSYSDFLIDRLELKFLSLNVDKTTDVSHSYISPLLSRNMPPYNTVTYNSPWDQTIDRIAEEFRTILANNLGSWWVVSDCSFWVEEAYNGNSGTRCLYTFYFHQNKQLSFSELSASSYGNSYVTFFDDNGPIRDVTSITFGHNVYYTGNTYLRYHFISEVPKVLSISEKKVSSFQLGPKQKLFLANVLNSDDLGIPKTFSSSESNPNFRVQDFYPKVSVYVDKGNLLASLDFDSFTKDNVKSPDVAVFSLTNSSGSIIPNTSIGHGFGLWKDLPKGYYRIILDSSWFPINDPGTHNLKPVFFDLEIDPNGNSYFVLFDESKNKYCFASNRLKDNSPVNIDSITNSTDFFSVFSHLISSDGNLNPGELYYRCDDFPQPQINGGDPNDFSSFSAQGFSEYENVCEALDIGCHLNKFAKTILKGFINLVKLLFIPDQDFLKNSLRDSTAFMLRSFGSFADLYAIVDPFISNLVSVLIPSLDNYRPPCDIFGNVNIMGAQASLDICVFERAIGSENFQRLTFMISVGLYFSAILLIRSTYLTVLSIINGGGKK